MAELWDLYDAQRQRTGGIVERGARLPEGCLHTVVHLVLVNTRGEMLVQRRADDKPTWPGIWDLTVGGSVIAGETSQEGIARETREELGLDIDFSGVRPALTMNFRCGFDDYYVLRRDVDLCRLSVPNQEVAEAAWAGLDRILELKRAGAFVEYRASVLAMLLDFVGHEDVFEATPNITI